MRLSKSHREGERQVTPRRAAGRQHQPRLRSQFNHARYDGIGNLVSEVATKGSAPTSSHAYDPTTNRLLDSSYTYDANGNLTAMPGLGMTYNEENRMTQAVSNLNGTERYGYDPEGMKVWQRGPDGVLHVYFNGVDGKPLGDFTGTSYFNGSYTVYNPVGGGTPMVYFAGKRIDNNTVEDRVATAVAEGGQGMKFFPYGELRSGTAGVVQYASYTRDSVVTNLDYAQHRWYSSQIDRFTTVDPKAGSANPEMPQSWNKYAYTLGDPVNNSDTTGLQDEEDADLNCYEYGMLWPSVVCDLAAGPHPPVRRSPPTLFPECNPTGNPLIERKLNYINDNYDDALNEANSVEKGVTDSQVSATALATMFLQWSVAEAGYPGSSAQVTAENNWFGFQRAGVGGWSGLEVACPPSRAIPGNSTNACFSKGTDWGQELNVALSTVSSKTGITFGQALENALGAGASSTAAALQAIAKNGWNPSGTYGADVTKNISIQSQVDCLKKNGYIP